MTQLSSSFQPLPRSKISLIIRSTLFNIYFFVASALCAIGGCIWLLGSRKSSFKAAILWEQVVHWGTKYIVGLDYRIEGYENLPRGACILASKHQSAWETCSFCGIFPTVVFIAKKELSYIPFIGFHFMKQKVILVNRRLGAKAKSDMIRQAKERVQEQDRIIIFPEGSRTAVGSSPKLKTGIFYMQQELGIPVVPVALNSGVYWPRRQFLKYPGVITVRILPPLPQGLSRETFMQQLEEAIHQTSKDLC